MTMPNCRTCKDTGLIPAEYGMQPCPMCEAWESRARAKYHIRASRRWYEPLDGGQPFSFQPLSDWTACIGNVRYTPIAGQEPNTFHRFMQRWMLGIRWERTNRADEARERVPDDRAAERHILRLVDSIILGLIVTIISLIAACWWLLPGGRA